MALEINWRVIQSCKLMKRRDDATVVLPAEITKAQPREPETAGVAGIGVEAYFPVGRSQGFASCN